MGYSSVFYGFLIGGVGGLIHATDISQGESPQVLGRVSRPQFSVTWVQSLKGQCKRLRDGMHTHTESHIQIHSITHLNLLTLLATL